MLIYLDIDGVMVPANSWRKLEILKDGFPEFSPRAVNALNKILSKSNADIVLTTSHKHRYTLVDWISIFKNRNINIKTISRLPENKNHLNRKNELLNWFTDKNLSKNFIIIDDDKSLNSLPDFLKDKLVQTSASVGLTDFLADETIKIINKLKLELA
jgi:hypothetical protein